MSVRTGGVRLARWLCLAAAVLLACYGGGGTGARGQEKKDAPKAADRAAAKPAPRAVNAVAFAAAAPNAWSDEQFEQYFFQQDRSAAAARRRFESLLKLHVEEIDRACGLTEAQRAKVQLIGGGDIKRHFEGFETALRQFNAVDNDVNRLQEIVQAIRPMQMGMQLGSPFETNSLLAKSMRNVLTAEQFARYDAVARERAAQRHRAQIELAVHMIEQAMPLRDAQRRELTELLVKECKPVRAAGYYTFYVTMDRLNRLPPEKLKPLLTNPQWTVLERLTGQYKNIIPQLRQNGLVLDDDEDDAPDKNEERVAPRGAPPKAEAKR